MRIFSVAVFLLTLGFALGLDVFLFVRGHWATPPLVFVAFACALALPRLPELPAVTRSPVWRLSLGCLLLAMFGFVAPGQGELAWQALQSTLLGFVFVTAWLLVYRGAGARRAGTRAAIAALAIAVAMNVYEVVHPLTWSDVVGRSAGTLMNPNLAALVLLLAAAYLAARDRRAGARAAVLGAAGVGVLLTFSRSGIAIWICLVAWFAWSAEGLRLRGRVAAVAVAALLVLGAFLLLPGELLHDTNVAQRLSVVRGRGFDDASVAERVRLLEEGLRRFEQRPLFGHGPGQSAGVAVGATVRGTHNDYLAFAIDYGLLGLLLWLAYLGSLARCRAFPVLIVVALSALSFHSLLWNRQVLLFLALYESDITARPAQEAF